MPVSSTPCKQGSQHTERLWIAHLQLGGFTVTWTILCTRGTRGGMGAASWYPKALSKWSPILCHCLIIYFANLPCWSHSTGTINDNCHGFPCTREAEGIGPLTVFKYHFQVISGFDHFVEPLPSWNPYGHSLIRQNPWKCSFNPWK